MIDYKNGPKNDWRRWAWNRIVERLTVPPREAIVLYLPGPKDLDRAEAIRRGFKNDNMIGIERDASTRSRLRSSGALVANGDFWESVDAFPPDRAVHVVFGDLTCGLKPEFPDNLQRWMYMPHTCEAVFAINLLRGRDQSSDTLRKYTEFVANHQKIDQSYGADFLVGRPLKHRGSILAYTAINRVATDWFRGEFEDCHGGTLDPTDVHYLIPHLHKLNAARKSCIDGARVATSSYKSRTQIFDSVVLVSPLRQTASSIDENARSALVAHLKKRLAGSPARRNMAPILAHRTARMR